MRALLIRLTLQPYGLYSCYHQVYLSLLGATSVPFEDHRLYEALLHLLLLLAHPGEQFSRLPPHQVAIAVLDITSSYPVGLGMGKNSRKPAKRHEKSGHSCAFLKAFKPLNASFHPFSHHLPRTPAQNRHLHCGGYVRRQLQAVLGGLHGLCLRT